MNISINACSAYCGDLLWTNEAFKIVTESLSKTNQRAIISSGWNNVQTNQLTNNIYFVKFIPHTWLFRHVAAVIHHGGAGTTAAGLRAGLPTYCSAIWCRSTLLRRMCISIGSWA